MKDTPFTLFRDPADIDFESLRVLLQKYPWFSVLHLIWILKIKNERPQEFPYELKKHIIFIRSRKNLYEILHGDLWKKLIEKSENPASSIMESEPADPGASGKELLEFSYDESLTSEDPDLSDEVLKSDKGDLESPSENPNSSEPSDPSESGFASWIEKFDNDGNKKIELIDRFLEAEPGPIRADKETWLTGDVSKKSVEENDHFITDTLAKIYIKQGLYTKAIFAYEKLSLKYPEKSAYFAAQIEEIKSLTHNN